MIVSVFLISMLVALVASTPPAPKLSARATTATGDTYAASHTANGDWYIYQATVYDGTNEVSYGNITIVSGGLTFKSATLTVDLATQYNHVITVADGAYFTISHATLRTSNSSTGVPWVNITAASNGNIRISNSTVKHFDIKPYASNDWIDNSTLHATKIDCQVGGLYKTRINITHNSIDSLVAGQAITGGFPLDSNITYNTITANNTQTYAAGASGWINVLGPYSGQSRGTRVIGNDIQTVVKYVGIYLIQPSRVYVSGNTIDHVYRDNSVAYRMNAGIFLSGEGSWSSVDNNTIRHVTGFPTQGGYTGFNIGIAADYRAAHWNITHNGIWRVGSAENNSCLGIDYEGSHANIRGNNLSYVGLDQGPAYINTAGIIVENNFMGVYDPGFAFNALNCKYVNTTYNVIDRVQQSSNGITYGWSLDGHNVTLGEVAHNRIGVTYAGSGGIGIYVHVSHINVHHNTISSIYHDSYGIGVADDAKYITVSYNDLHVVSLYLTNYAGDYYGEGVSAWSEGAIMMGSELSMDTLAGSIFSYNHITIDDRSNGPGKYLYSDYVIHYCSGLTTANRPIFILSESATFAYIETKLLVEVEAPGSNIRFFMNDTMVYGPKTGGASWGQDANDDSWQYLSVRISEPSWGSQFAVIGIIWVVVFAVLLSGGLLASLNYVLKHGD